MKNYSIELRTIKKSNILNKNFSLSSYNYKILNFRNNNIIPLKNIIYKEIKGFEPGSETYINFSKNKFIRIQDLEIENFIFNENKKTQKINIKKISDKNLSKKIQKGDLIYQTASNIGNVCFYNGEEAFYNSHLIKIKIKPIFNKYYIFAILKSNFNKNQVDIQGSIKGIDNFSKDILYNTIIPFPTKENNENPEDVENLISLIIQNIIDKEKKIKEKNQLIDDLIEKELLKNQKENIDIWNYPKITEIKKELRLDTGLYEKEFKKIYNKILNYKYGNLNLTKKNGFEITRGQNLQFSNIGTSIYRDIKKNEQYYKLILSKNIGKRKIKNFSYIGNKNKLKEIKNEDIIFSCRGEMGRSYLFNEIQEKMITNIDNVHIRNKKLNFENKVFLFTFINFLKEKRILSYISCEGSGAPSFTQYQFNKICIPLFPEEIQKKISKEYYNKVEKELNFENYLEKEEMRNSQLGISQLNIEIFHLKEILEDLIDRVIMNKRIEINFKLL